MVKRIKIFATRNKRKNNQTKGKLNLHLSSLPFLFFISSMALLFGEGSFIVDQVGVPVQQVAQRQEANQCGFHRLPERWKLICHQYVTHQESLQEYKWTPIAGETKVWQHITLLRRIFLIDCSGAVFRGPCSKGKWSSSSFSIDDVWRFRKWWGSSWWKKAPSWMRF
jgi:hypothetical protein